MNNQVQITEEDIFYFVHYPETLSVEKTIYINANQDKFSSMIDFYQSFTNSISAEEIEHLKSKIEKRLVNQSTSIKLLPTWMPEHNEETGLRLAAASTTLDKKANSISFADLEQKFLIRILHTNENSLLYILPSVEIPSINNIEIIIHPSETKYSLHDISTPLEIESELIINSIEITFY